MKIQKLRLQNFKRFSDLTIDCIPESAKLVLLIGANGSGKSSVFDAFGFCVSKVRHQDYTTTNDWEYYRKEEGNQVSVKICFDQNYSITLKSDNSISREVTGVFSEMSQVSSNILYGRTSFRQIPRLTRTSLGQTKVDFEKDSDRPRYFIDRDERFENDIDKLIGDIIKEVFSPEESQKTAGAIRDKYITPINSAFARIFGDTNGTRLELLDIIPPRDGKVSQINFRKGKSTFHYNNLSAGEKEVFNILINLLSRRDMYQDTVYFFDEIDLHLNTSLQFRLLKEITENWIPENCQLWTASHSLGFIEYAKQSDIACIIDFDSYDFDTSKTLVPEVKDNPEIYDIAVGKEFLSSLFADKKIVFVENKDRKYYAMLNLPETIFVPANNREQVCGKVRIEKEYYGIVDRDFLTDEDIALIQTHYPHLYVLQYYSVENYLYHPDNLAEYYQSKNRVFDRKQYIVDLTEAKNREKNSFIVDLTQDRSSYPYFKEPQYNEKPLLQKRFKNANENKEQAQDILTNINSDDFETFYKSLPMKTYCTQLAKRQNIPRSELAKTNWFCNQITELLQ